MDNKDYGRLIDAIHSGTSARGLAARMIILSAQEAAVNDLADLYYAGIPEAHILIVFDLLAEIGGPDALAVLRSAFAFQDLTLLKRAAAQGLLRNLNNLSTDEADEIAQYLVISSGLL